MKPYIRYIICVLSVVVLSVVLAPHAVCAETLYEQYVNKPKAELDAETAQMGKSLKKVFNEASIEKYQQKIDFADYYSNLKKLVLYGAKLANYADHEENLSFAKDKEIFKGLPENSAGDAKDRKAFVNEKYEKMKVNVKDEIDTYVDLINISLDACEIASRNDLSGFMDNRENRDTIRNYLDESRTYKLFAQRYERLEKDWPELAKRIHHQISLWQPAAASPDDPIIDPKLTEAIL